MPETEQPVQPEYKEKITAVARAIDDFLNPDPNNKTNAFAIFMFPFGAGDDHRCNYMSNASRDTIIATLKEFIARVEGTYVEREGTTV